MLSTFLNRVLNGMNRAVIYKSDINYNQMLLQKVKWVGLNLQMDL